MKSKKRKIEEPEFQIKPTKFFWAIWLIGLFLLALGVFLLPVWESVDVFWNTWATKSVAMTLFVLLTVYIVCLVVSVKKDAPKAKNILRIAEIALLIVVALLCFLQHFNAVHFVGPCFVVGAILWLRGVVCSLTAYMFNVKKKDRTLGVMIVGLTGVTLGAILMVRRFTAPIFMWIISIGLILVALATIPYGIMAIPKKEK